MEEAKGRKRCINNSPVERISVRATGKAGSSLCEFYATCACQRSYFYRVGTRGRARSKASRMQIMERSTLAFN